MKLKNKKWVTLSIVIGIALIATTVLADNISKSPYDQLKSAIKSTSSQMSGTEIESYTVNTRFTLRDNDTLLLEKITEQKNVLGGIEYENIDFTTTPAGEFMSGYSFNNSKKNIWYDRYSDIYYVTENQYPQDDYVKYRTDYSLGYDPLADERVDDYERIIDALVGNLKNYVTVERQDDESMVFSGALSDAQIPAVINAIASFLTKQFLDNSGGYPNDILPIHSSYFQPGTDSKLENSVILPKLDGDVFIKSLSGRISADESGLINSVYADIILSGKDEDGNSHVVNFEIEIDITDINETEIFEPDLTGKNVQLNQFNDEPIYRLTAKYEGLYKNDIVIEDDEKFVKIGERYVVIESIDQTEVLGRYYEIYYDGYETQNPVQFEFKGQNAEPNFTLVSYELDDNNYANATISFEENGTILQFHPESTWSVNGKYNFIFARVFD